MARQRSRWPASKFYFTQKPLTRTHSAAHVPEVRALPTRGEACGPPLPTQRCLVAQAPLPAQERPVAQAPLPAQECPVARAPLPAQRCLVAQAPLPTQRCLVAQASLPGPGFKQVSTQAILSRGGPFASSCSSDKAQKGFSLALLRDVRLHLQYFPAGYFPGPQ